MNSVVARYSSNQNLKPLAVVERILELKLFRLFFIYSFVFTRLPLKPSFLLSLLLRAIIHSLRRSDPAGEIVLHAGDLSYADCYEVQLLKRDLEPSPPSGVTPMTS